MANGVNRTRRDRKSYTFTMSMPDVVWTCVGAVFALTVFFLFGVLVGRGYLPADPDAGTGSMAQVESAAEAAAPGQPDAAPEAPAAEVLRAEDLAYQDQLDKPEAGGEQSGETAEAAPAAAAPEQGTEQGAATAETAAPGVFDAANLPAPAPGEKPYHYTYQAAAFKDEAAATALADKLKSKGLPARVAEGKTSSATWYRVQIPFTGTPSQTRPLRDAVQEVTGEKPVMVSKKSAE